MKEWNKGVRHQRKGEQTQTQKNETYICRRLKISILFLHMANKSRIKATASKSSNYVTKKLIQLENNLRSQLRN